MFNNAATLITKDYILSKVSEEEIFTKYLGIEPTDRGSFVNPLRSSDDNPGCGFYVNPQGTWKFIDRAAGYNWDCFNVVEFAYQLNFKEALIRIAVDFNLIQGNASNIYITNKPRAKKIQTEIRIKRRKWTIKDYKFWKSYHITPERLEFFQVSPVLQAWLSDEHGALKLAYGHKDSDPGFAYHFGGYDYKLYFPLRQKGKFLHVKSAILQGYSQLPDFGDNLLYTKSFKDVMCIDIFSIEFDLYSVAPMSETVVVDQETFKDLYNRFENQGTLFDFDRAGIRLMQKYKQEYSLQPYMFGLEFRTALFGKQPLKDFADYVKIKGLDETRRLIERFLTKKEHDTSKVF